MKCKTLASALLMACLSLATVSCAKTEQLPVREMPANATFSGQWVSNFGYMKLKQMEDGTTRGSYDYKNGQIEGRVEGGVFTFRWVQPGDFNVGRREVSGHGYLVISDDGLALEGEWGYYDNYRGGGTWTAKKQTELYN